jgi:uncharacterized protein YabE (DUF348 family)
MNNWIRRWNIFVDVIKLLIVSVIISLFIVGNLYALYTFNHMLARIERRIELHELQHRLQVEDLLDILQKGLNISYENDKNQLILAQTIVETMKSIVTNTEQLQITQNKIQKEITTLQPIDLTLSAHLQEANVLIGNITQGCGGSGTHIKLNDKSYILTCAHLVDTTDDMLIAFLDNGDMCPLQLVKINYEKD